MTPRWKQLLEPYSDLQVENLERGARIEADRIEKAAVDPANKTVVDGIDISCLWFAVERRRDELSGASAPAEEPVEAPVEPVEEEKAPDPSNDVPEAEEAAETEEAPAVPEEAPKPTPKPKGRPRKTA